MRRFLLAFIGIGLLLYGLVYLPPIRDSVIAPFTDGLTAAAGGLIALFGGQAWVQGNVPVSYTHLDVYKRQRLLVQDPRLGQPSRRMIARPGQPKRAHGGARPPL